MIDIKTIKGDTYSFDETTQKIFKNGIEVPESLCEPIFSNLGDEDVPEFSGILLKDKQSIVSRTGVINPITNINSIKI